MHNKLKKLKLRFDKSETIHVIVDNDRLEFSQKKSKRLQTLDLEIRNDSRLKNIKVYIWYVRYPESRGSFTLRFRLDIANLRFSPVPGITTKNWSLLSLIQRAVKKYSSHLHCAFLQSDISSLNFFFLVFLHKRLYQLILDIENFNSEDVFKNSRNVEASNIFQF